MSYVQFISLLRETNRCPGGKASIAKIVRAAHVDRGSRVLEVGSNTGFTSLEVARSIKCEVIGIDVVPEAVAESRRVLAADTAEIQNLVRFEIGSAYEIPFGSDQFDLLIAGGATSFMDDKRRALDEYYRVLKPWGFLSITNLYYEKVPPSAVVRAVSDLIGVEIKAWSFEQWMDVLRREGRFELYHVERQFLGAHSEDRLDAYVDYFLRKPHLADLSNDVRIAIKQRWRRTLDVFNENHRYLGFLLALFRKRYDEEEPELFIPQGAPHVTAG